MAGTKKTLITLFKIGIGLLSFWMIYTKLVAIPHLKEECARWLYEPKMYITLLGMLLLMPLNWGIESYKWKIITQSLQFISYKTALKSVFTGICIGNIAPGRAMEFLAKIYFFKPENRPTATVLHFINGMFQMLMTVTAGVLAIVYKLNQSQQSPNFIFVVLIIGLCLLLFFCWAITHVSFIKKKITFIPWFKQLANTEDIVFSKRLLFQLLSLSFVRYMVFTGQFYLIYNTLYPANHFIASALSIASYFMLTSLIPMISAIELAIRAAIALFVFSNVTDNSVVVVLCSTSVWIINVVIPSAIGYLIILNENIQFKMTHDR